MYVLTNITAIYTDQHQPILPFSKDDITRKDLNLQTVQIDIKKKENSDDGSECLTPLLDDDNKDNDKDDSGREEHEENQKHEDHEDTFQVETNIEITSIMDAVHKLSKEGNERKTITFLDFAGQNIYYAFQQIYFSPESFFILVVDMRKDPKHLCENDDMCCSRFNSWTYKGNEIKTIIYM